jgi:hypothetical protein
MDSPEDIQDASTPKFRFFSLPEIIFISFMAALNVSFDLLLSPVIILLLGHVIAGIMIMVPINFIFISLTKHLVDKIGSLTMYMVIFGIISIPTTFYGAIPGVYKLLAGFVVGIILDIAYIIRKPVILKIVMGGLIGSIGWWFGTFLIWTGLGFPFIEGMSNLVNESINLSSIMEIPIKDINGDFFLFVLICGIFSAVQCIILTALTYPIAQSIKKTAIYTRFTMYKI